MKIVLIVTLGFATALRAFGAGLPDNGSVDENGYEVHVVESGRYRLETGLELPGTYEAGDGPIPAVIFAPGSGGDSVFPNYVPGFIDTFLREPFGGRGYALVHYNKRGLGRSTGNYKRGSLETRTGDLLAIVDHYRNDPRIDPARIGIVGHSQGGWVVMMAGGRDPEIDFLISLAGPTTTLRVHDLERHRMGAECAGLTGEELEDDVAGRNRALDRMIFWGSFFPFFDLGFMHDSIDHDPAPDIKSITQPALLAYGEFDSMVKPVDSIDRLAEIFPSGVPDHISAHVAPGTDHMFHVTNTTCFDYWASVDDPYSEAFISHYDSWIQEYVASR